MEKNILCRGSSASLGKGKGPVRLYPEGTTDFSDFRKGDVLVTPMTNPDFVSVMKMAEAIVTDIGGITCHAAIIAREFGVPCIVGTGNATKVLKIGDVVIVNATDGEVYTVN